MNLEPFGFFEFTPIGAAVLLVGTAYKLLVGRRLLSASHPEDKPEDTGPTIDELVDRYGLRDKFPACDPRRSPLVGRTLGAAKLRTLFGVAAVGIERREGRQLSIAPALPQTEFRAGDVLYVTGHEEPAKHFVDSQGLEHLAIETAPRTDIQEGAWPGGGNHPAGSGTDQEDPPGRGVPVPPSRQRIGDPARRRGQGRERDG